MHFLGYLIIVLSVSLIIILIQLISFFPNRIFINGVIYASVCNI